MVGSQRGTVWVGTDPPGMAGRFNLLSYQGAWLSCALIIAALASCERHLVGWMFGLLRRGTAAVGDRSELARQLVVFVVATATFWLLRERTQLADSEILVLWASQDGNVDLAGLGYYFFFPEVGSTLLLGLAAGLGRAVSTDPVAFMQGLICVSGGVSVLLCLRLASFVAITEADGSRGGDSPAADDLPGWPGMTAALLLSGGMARVFAGHVEVYAFLLAAVLGYLCCALRYLQGRGSWRTAAVALGVAVWMHAAAVCLAPGLAWLLVPGEGVAAWDRVRRLISGGLLVAAPMVGFLLLFGLLAHGDDALQAWNKMLQVIGQDPHHRKLSLWVRGWGGAASVGTDLVFLSRAHLKYLANAFYLLHPFALPAIAFCAVKNPRVLIATADARFLLVTLGPLLAYSLVLRPLWGPYDWDLFSTTSLCAAVLAVRLLFLSQVMATRRFLVTAIALLQLFLVGIPFLAVGVATPRDAGPFSHHVSFDQLIPPRTPPPPELAPWL